MYPYTDGKVIVYSKMQLKTHLIYGSGCYQYLPIERIRVNVVRIIIYKKFFIYTYESTQKIYPTDFFDTRTFIDLKLSVHVTFPMYLEITSLITHFMSFLLFYIYYYVLSRFIRFSFDMLKIIIKVFRDTQTL